MKRIVCTAVFVFSIMVLYAQKSDTHYFYHDFFYKHEIRASVGDALTSEFWLQDGGCYVNFSIAYFYRPVKWLWVGGNFINYVGDKVSYNWREYNTDGTFRDLSKSKIKYCAVIAPEVRFSFLNKETIILYSALSGGIGWEDGYDDQWQKYPITVPYLQITYIGFSFNFGKNKNIFVGGEQGIGFKGLINIHGGYRF